MHSMASGELIPTARPIQRSEAWLHGARCPSPQTPAGGCIKSGCKLACWCSGASRRSNRSTCRAAVAAQAVLSSIHAATIAAPNATKHWAKDLGEAAALRWRVRSSGLPATGCEQNRVHAGTSWPVKSPTSPSARPCHKTSKLTAAC